MKALQEQLIAYQPQGKPKLPAKQKFCGSGTVWAMLCCNGQKTDITVSSIILNPSLDAMLMVYHNIYQSLAWTGGHADGAEKLAAKSGGGGKKREFCN